jgi:hypothetical protein
MSMQWKQFRHEERTTCEEYWSAEKPLLKVTADD